MRTTLTLDDDVLGAAKTLATARGVSVGQIVSELARTGLSAPQSVTKTRGGVVLFPVRPGAAVVTPEIVQELLDETE